MEPKPFKVGDVVRLNSGSPDLTVVNINEDYVTCTWTEDSQPVTHAFPPATLTLMKTAS